MSGWLASALALLVAQTAGRGPQVDPTLPASVRPVVEAAVAAELDPKRGAANAAKVIERAQAEHAPDGREGVALRLRRAAVLLRNIFLTRPDFAESLRYEQALSTFSRLDLTEPGLEAWIDRTVAHHALAKERFGRKKDRVIAAALLLRGSELERDRVEALFEASFAKAGFTVRFVPVKGAAYVIKLATAGAKSPRPDQRAVRVVLGIEHVVKGEVAWRTNLFRTTTAPTPEAALSASLEWLVRVGGRDLLFRWLGVQGLPTLIGDGPLSLQSHEHEH